MGWDVHAVKRSSVWEFFSSFNGYVDANTPKQPGKLTEEDKDRIWDRMQELEASSGPRVLSTQTYVLDGLQLIAAGEVSFRIDPSA